MKRSNKSVNYIDGCEQGGKGNGKKEEKEEEQEEK